MIGKLYLYTIFWTKFFKISSYTALCIRTVKKLFAIINHVLFYHFRSKVNKNFHIFFGFVVSNEKGLVLAFFLFILWFIDNCELFWVNNTHYLLKLIIVIPPRVSNDAKINKLINLFDINSAKEVFGTFHYIIFQKYFLLIKYPLFY